ncbi:MAG: hypothetical protein AAGF12_15310 [Myxococcota bacterium]
MDAIALLRATDDAFKAFSKDDSASDQELEVWRGHQGATFGAQRLGNAVAVHTGKSFGTDPEALYTFLTDTLGPELLGHDDDRGVLVFPDVAKPHGDSYDEIVGELGEGGEWIRPPAVETLDLQRLAENLGAALPPGALAGLGEALAEAGGLEAIAKQAQEMLANPGTMPAGLVDAAREMSDKIASGEAELPLPDPNEAPDLFAQAQQMAEQLQAQDPEQFAALQRQFAGLMGGPNDADEGAADEGAADEDEGSA